MNQTITYFKNLLKTSQSMYFVCLVKELFFFDWLIYLFIFICCLFCYLFRIDNLNTCIAKKLHSHIATVIYSDLNKHIRHIITHIYIGVWYTSIWKRYISAKMSDCHTKLHKTHGHLSWNHFLLFALKILSYLDFFVTLCIKSHFFLI